MRHFIKQIKQIERHMLAAYPRIYDRMSYFRTASIEKRGFSWSLGYMPRAVVEVAVICESYRQSTSNPLAFPPKSWWDSFHKTLLCSHLSSCAHALRSWSFTKRVYNMDPALSELLINTSIPDTTPADIFTRLPEWGLCIKSNTGNVKNDLLQCIEGFVVSIQDDPIGGSPGEFENCQGLEVLILMNDHQYQSTFLHFAPGETVADIINRTHEGIERACASGESSRIHSIEETREHTSTLIKAILSITLYFCSENPDYKGGIPGGKPKIGIKGKFEFPKEPRVIQVGSVLGAKLKEQSTKSQAQSSGKRPHMRKAHWHGVWTGPKNDPANPQKFKLNWIPPTFINCDTPT